MGLDGDIDGMVHLSDISWDQRGEDAIQNYRKGDTVQASVQEVDVEKERISLSIKAREIAEEKEAVEQYGSSDSGASLGDILGAALKSRD